MGTYRSNPYAPKLQELDDIKALLDALNGKTVTVNTNYVYTHSPLEVAMAGDKVATFSYLNNIASGSSTNIYLSNPSDSGLANFAMYVDTTDQGRIHVYYDPEVDTGNATQLTPKVPIVGKTANVSVEAYGDVTINTSTPDLDRVVPGGSGWHAVGNTTAGLPGFGLLPGHSMAIELENKSSNYNAVSFFLVYWEQ